MKYKTIIWDWNGTLLNDVTICCIAMNGMLQKRSMPLLSKERYKSIFTFPVKEYYEKIGWNFSQEPFDLIAMEFIDSYRNLLPKATLFTSAKKVLSAIKNSDIQQLILSAMQHNFLHESVSALGITNYFESINGISNHFAVSKQQLAQQLFVQHEFSAQDTIIIGDTLHDAEIAKNMGVDCILISAGHQSHERLVESGFTVIKSVNEIPAFLM